jgi:PKD repeat protein
VNATVKNPVHTYSTPGNYTVALTAKNAAGSNTFTRTKYITLAAAPIKPVAAFTGTPTSGTAPLKVSFTDASTNTPTSWSWSFGDGSSVNATVKNPIHTYSTPGNYTVALTATNAGGDGNMIETNYIQVTSPVNQPPILSSITDKTTEEGKLLTFTVTATDPESNLLTYSASGLPANAVFDASTQTFIWTPADNQSGIYTVTFRVSDGALSDMKNVIITVNQNSESKLKNLRINPSQRTFHDGSKKYYISLQ